MSTLKSFIPQVIALVLILIAQVSYKKRFFSKSSFRIITVSALVIDGGLLGYSSLAFLLSIPNICIDSCTPELALWQSRVSRLTDVVFYFIMCYFIGTLLTGKHNKMSWKMTFGVIAYFIVSVIVCAILNYYDVKSYW